MSTSWAMQNHDSHNPAKIDLCSFLQVQFVYEYPYLNQQ